MQTPESGFAGGVCAAFGLDQAGPGRTAFDPARLRLTPMRASSTRLWELTTASGRFVVKEFPYHDGNRPDRIAVAADFEYSIWRAGRLLMPAPVRTLDGELIVRIPGSRGEMVPVRVHRWLTGDPVPAPPPLAAATEAGRALAVIHQSAPVPESRPPGSVRWWTDDPGELARRLAAAGVLTGGLAGRAAAAFELADVVLTAGEGLPGSWRFTHCDHKPENCLLVGRQVAVLDWDECGYCHPRLEVTESALRWAGADLGEPGPEVFCAFLRGYEDMLGASFGPVETADTAKWIAALIGWFWFTGRRALGAFAGETAAERRSAGRQAARTIATLDRTMSGLARWTDAFARHREAG